MTHKNNKQYHLPFTVIFRRIRTASPLRPAFQRSESAFCGTAIAVPYRSSYKTLHDTEKGPQIFLRSFLSIIIPLVRVFAVEEPLVQQGRNHGDEAHGHDGAADAAPGGDHDHGHADCQTGQGENADHFLPAPSTMPLARPTMPCSSLGMMILVA